jgi:hypothetical protein
MRNQYKNVLFLGLITVGVILMVIIGDLLR